MTKTTFSLLLAVCALAALAGSVALSARANAAPPATTSGNDVGVMGDGSAWVVVGNTVEYCYLNQSSRPVCETARRYPAP